MRGWRSALFAIAATTLVSSCSRPPVLVLLNNVGQGVDIVFAAYTGGANQVGDLRFWWESILQRAPRVSQGRARVFTRLAQFAGSWTVQLQTGNCRLSFEIPAESGHAYLSNAWPRLPHDEIGPVDPTVQLEPDQSLYLIPLGARRAWDVETVRHLQPEGFPIAPIERCAEQS
jgi:hypothetical protein